MDILEKNLTTITDCIRDQRYTPVETERFELKDLSAGWGDDWYKSVCAFLNTGGGMIVIGINEKNNAKPPHYKFTGYVNSEANESHLKNELPRKFTNRAGSIKDISEYISFEIRSFLNGNLAVVYVDALPDDEKYVWYKGVAYHRKLTGDHALSLAEVETFEELQREIIQHQELTLVEDAGLDALNIDVLNDYILRFNRGKKKGETLKADVAGARSFLVREGFARGEHPTLLGMLVCGNSIEQFIQGKCQADCYVMTQHKVARDKEIIQDNIIGLIEQCFNFLWRNIQVGVSYARSGSAEPEYPEALLRESINNAFAHRDYKSSRFVIIEIRPNESLMIRNPGAFERRQRLYADTEFGKLRRIIPLQVARNPKLTHLLKSFDFWEGKGRGLASLIDACLDNVIDVPYYILSEGEIKLFIPKGKVLDAAMELWLKSFEGFTSTMMRRRLNTDERVMLSFFRKSEELNRLEQYTILLTMDNNHKASIAALEECGLILKNPASTEIYPVYQVHRQLMQKDVAPMLVEKIGHEWQLLKSEYQDVLKSIYLHNEFGLASNSVSANSIAEFLYFSELFAQGKKGVDDLAHYENFKRKIRSIFNQLEKKGLIQRNDGKTKQTGGKPDFVIAAGHTEV
jgi:ATP-dependent DNA helicase RecG